MRLGEEEQAAMISIIIFWRNFFAIDFYCKSGRFLIQNRHTSFKGTVDSCLF